MMATDNTGNDLNEYTGRHLVLIDQQAKKTSIKSYSKKAGINFVSSVDLTDGVDSEQILGSADGIIYEKLGVGIINDMPEQVSKLMDSNGSNPFYYSEPEVFVYAISDVDYLKGFKDAASILYEAMIENNHSDDERFDVIKNNERKATWGISRTNVLNSSFTGRNVDIAILDTGFYGKHPDFKGRKIVGKSFIKEEKWNEDRNGHGTHCIGTACGGHKSDGGLRYGVAIDSNIFVGKVLSDSGTGTSGGVIEGINWAIENNCKVISMSLGSRVAVGQKPSPIYEKAGIEALKHGSLIIAAAGNDSRRPTFVNPVGSPANCKSIMAVAALDKNLKSANFSNGGINLDGGKIDIAAPGIGVLSSWSPLRNTSLYNTISGTSMATPHVSGIAALLFEAFPSASPEQIWMMLIQNSMGIGLPSEDVGAGLAQA